MKINEYIIILRNNAKIYIFVIFKYITYYFLLFYSDLTTRGLSPVNIRL